MAASFFSWEDLLDVLYPPGCLGCDREGDWVCGECLDGLPFFSSDEELLVVGSYGHPLVRVLLTRLKYQAAVCLLPTMGRLVQRFRFERQRPWPWAGESALALCVVPSDQERVRVRGVDHAFELGEIVHRELVPWAHRSNILRRKRRANQNARLPPNELRAVNVRGAFEVTTNISGAVLLVDDIYTTGATWNEAARVLQAAGASRVYGFVFAKG